jgi:glycosyltransferase involved in cell wall biosynthesis
MNAPINHPGSSRSRRGRPRVLLIAESCNPEMISVPLVGYCQARELSKLADTHVVTHPRNRPALERAGWREGEHFTTIDTERLTAFTWNLGETISGRGKGWTLQAALYTPTYFFFEHLLWERFGRRITDGEFDIVHRLVPLSPTIPSPIAAKCRRAGVPFVVGPLNGGVPWPRQFDAARRKEGEWLSYVRGAHRLLPGYLSMRRDASAMLIASRDTWAQVPRSFRDRCVYLPENGIDPERFSLRRTHRASRPLRVVFVGRLVPYKGADMLIEAVAPLVKAGAVVVDVIGDGPMMGELRQMVSKCGPGIDLHGWVEHARVQEWLARADVLAFPSVREFGGAVVLEAMAVGCVPIVLDYGGPAELVTERSGFLVPMGDRQQIIERFRAVLADLAEHPETIESLSEGAYRRAREQFTWEIKARRTMQVYDWVLNPGSAKPRFEMPEPDLDRTKSHAGFGASSPEFAKDLSDDPDSHAHPRVLIVAEHASTKWGGEAILPLHYFRILRQRGVEAWLVVHERTRPELEQLLPDQHDRIHYVHDTFIHRLIYKVGFSLPHQISYLTFQFALRVLSQTIARRTVRQLVERHKIDVVHQPIPVSPREPSLMGDVGAPVIIGPMNGGMVYPPGFRKLQNRAIAALMKAGRCVADLMNRVMPGKLAARTLLVANPRTRGALPRGTRGEVIALIENGVDLSLWEPSQSKSSPPRDNGADRPTRFIFAGRLIDWKVVDILLESFANVLKRAPATLDIIGDGPRRAWLEEMAHTLAISPHVRFHGWIPQAQCAQQFKAADVFVLPSLYECGGAVVLEAMASGLPVIATKWGGPVDYIDDTCGILVEPTSRPAFVEGLTAAMLELATNPDRRLRMGQAGRRKAADEFDWQRKVDRILEIYHRTAQNGRAQPVAGAAASDNDIRRPHRAPREPVLESAVA